MKKIFKKVLSLSLAIALTLSIVNGVLGIGLIQSYAADEVNYVVRYYNSATGQEWGYGTRSNGTVVNTLPSGMTYNSSTDTLTFTNVNMNLDGLTSPHYSFGSLVINARSVKLIGKNSLNFHGGMLVFNNSTIEGGELSVYHTPSEEFWGDSAIIFEGDCSLNNTILSVIRYGANGYGTFVRGITHINDSDITIKSLLNGSSSESQQRAIKIDGPYCGLYLKRSNLSIYLESKGKYADYAVDASGDNNGGACGAFESENSRIEIYTPNSAYYKFIVKQSETLNQVFGTNSNIYGGNGKAEFKFAMAERDAFDDLCEQYDEEDYYEYNKRGFARGSYFLITSEKLNVPNAYPIDQDWHYDKENGHHKGWISCSGEGYYDSDFIYHYGSLGIAGKVITVSPKGYEYDDCTYQFKSYSVNGVKQKSLSFVMPEGNVYITCEFERVAKEKPQSSPVAQTISGTSTYKKTVGDKAFTLNAKGKTPLSYSSSNKKVATVNDKGKVTIKGTGTTTITVTAKATDKYQKATKKITVKVGKLKSTTLSSVKKSGSKKLKVTWKKYSNADGYEVQYATKKNFSKSATKALKVKKAKTTTTTIKKLKAKRTYYVRVRTYKKVNGKTYYSNWSKVKSQKTK